MHNKDRVYLNPHPIEPLKPNNIQEKDCFSNIIQLTATTQAMQACKHSPGGYTTIAGENN